MSAGPTFHAAAAVKGGRLTVPPALPSRGSTHRRIFRSFGTDSECVQVKSNVACKNSRGVVKVDLPLGAGPVFTVASHVSSERQQGYDRGPALRRVKTCEIGDAVGFVVVRVLVLRDGFWGRNFVFAAF